MAAAINDWGELIDHRSYMLQLRRDHGRKYGFWSEVPKKIIPEPEVLNLRWKLKLWIRVWVRQGGRAEGCAALGPQLLKLVLFSLVYGERRAF